MPGTRRRTLTARELKSCIQRISWERLTEIHLATESQAVRRLIGTEARRCGYRMSGFVLAQTLRCGAEAGGPK